MTPTVPNPTVPVGYDDASHRYYFNGLTYLSATQIVEKFRQPFDIEERSAYMADRYGKTQQYWKDKWRDVNELSKVRGSLIHSEQEKREYQKKFLEFDAYANNGPQVVPVYRTTAVYANLLDGNYPEMLLWRHDEQIAGRSDKITIWSTKHKRYADIGDYKSNKKLNTESWQEKDGSRRMMLGPVSHLMDCEMVHYGLQLSLYQYMLEYHGFYPGIRYLIHFPHPTDEFPNPRPRLHKLPYYRDEVIAMIHHLKTLAA